jgi:hypothetical protein
MYDLLAVAICAFLLFVGGVMVGRAWGRIAAEDELVRALIKEARRPWDPTQDAGA